MASAEELHIRSILRSTLQNNGSQPNTEIEHEMLNRSARMFCELCMHQHSHTTRPIEDVVQTELNWVRTTVLPTRNFLKGQTNQAIATLYRTLKNRHAAQRVTKQHIHFGTFVDKKIVERYGTQLLDIDELGKYLEMIELL